MKVIPFPVQLLTRSRHLTFSVAIAFLFLVLVPTHGAGQTTNAAPPTSIPSINAPTATAPVPIALASVVAEADSTTLKLQDINGSLDSDQTLTSVETSLPQPTREIDEQEAEDARLLSGGNSLSSLRNAQQVWRTVDRNLDVLKKALVDRLSTLDAQIKQLSQEQQTWQATLAMVKTSAAPPEILQRVNAVLAGLREATRIANSVRTQTLSAQGRVAEQGARIQDALSSIQKAQINAVGLLFTRDSAPLWSSDMRAPQTGTSYTSSSLAAQVETLISYLHEKTATLMIQLLGFVLLAATLVWLRREVDARAKDDPALRHVAQVFEVPTATAILIALLVSGWLYPLAPRLFLAATEAAALIPAVIILRRLIPPSLFPVLYAMVLFYIFDQLRYLASSWEIASRNLFIFELLAGTLFLAWLIHSRRTLSAQGQPEPAQRIVLVYAHIGLLLFVFAGIANVLGYVHLSILIGNGTLSSSYLAVILYAGVRIADALALCALQVPPLARFGLVKRHYPLLARISFRFFRWAAFLFWLLETLDLLSIRTLVWGQISAVLLTKIGWNAHVIALGDILAFGITVWASFFISRVIRFVLEEEVFPHLQLPAGVPYTASTLAHYVILTLGFFAALEFLGIRLSNFAVLAGAFGVGLGFGLQNIMNNFVSGIILLFERPIKVGDIIQVDTAVGTVESIGIRASVIRLTNGSEVIVPNGNLISNPVTNWTFSNRHRMVDIPVTVVSKTDPQKVINVLKATAQNHPLVLKNPAPQAVVTNFTAAVLTLELRVWIDSPDAWAQIRSDLSVAINVAFQKENIAIG